MMPLKMKTTLDVCLAFLAVFLFTGSTAASLSGFPNDDTSDSAELAKPDWDETPLTLRKRDGTDVIPDDVAHQRFPMLRLGRSLGRSLRSAGYPDIDSEVGEPGRVQLSREALKTLLRALMGAARGGGGQAKDVVSRQPPLPRYGRRSIGLADRRTSDSSRRSASDNSIYSFKISVDDPVFRQPPRGGRYKRSVAPTSAPLTAPPCAAAVSMAGNTASGSQQTMPRVHPAFTKFALWRPGARKVGERAPPLPRIGRYLGQALQDIRSKMAPVEQSARRAGGGLSAKGRREQEGRNDKG